MFVDKDAFFARLGRRVAETDASDPRETMAEFVRLYVQTFADVIDAEAMTSMSRAVRAGLGLVSANTTRPHRPRRQQIPPEDAGPQGSAQPRVVERQRNPTFDDLPRHTFDSERDQNYPEFLEAFVRHLYVHRISERRLAEAMDVNHKTARAFTANVHDPETETVALACQVVGFSPSESEAVAAGAWRYRRRSAESGQDAAQQKVFFPIRPPRHRQLRDTDEARLLLRKHIWENYNHDSEYARKARVKYQYVGRFLLGTRRCTARDVTEMFRTAGAEPEFVAEVLEVVRREGWLTGAGVQMSGETLTESTDQRLRDFTAEYRKLYAGGVSKAGLDDLFARGLDEIFQAQIHEDTDDEVPGSILIGRRRVPRFPEFHQELSGIEPFRIELPGYLDQNDLSVFRFCAEAGIGIDSYNGFANGDGLWTAQVLDRVLDQLQVDERTRTVLTSAMSGMDATRARHNRREYDGALETAGPLTRPQPYLRLAEFFIDAEVWERRNNLAPGTVARAVGCPERYFPKYRKGTLTPTVQTVRGMLEVLSPSRARQHEVIELAVAAHRVRESERNSRRDRYVLDEGASYPLQDLARFVGQQRAARNLTEETVRTVAGLPPGSATVRLLEEGSEAADFHESLRVLRLLSPTSEVPGEIAAALTAMNPEWRSKNVAEYLPFVTPLVESSGPEGPQLAIGDVLEALAVGQPAVPLPLRAGCVRALAAAAPLRDMGVASDSRRQVTLFGDQGDQIFANRVLFGWSRQEFATAAGLDHRQVVRLEAGSDEELAGSVLAQLHPGGLAAVQEAAEYVSAELREAEPVPAAASEDVGGSEPDAAVDSATATAEPAEVDPTDSRDGPVWEYLAEGQEEALFAGASAWVSVYLTTVAHELKADSEFGRGFTVAEEARRTQRIRAIDVARPATVRWIMSEYTAAGLDDIRELSAAQQQRRQQAIGERRRRLISSHQLDVDPIVLAGEEVNLPPGVPLNFELLTVDGAYWLLDVTGGKAAQLTHFDTLEAAGAWVSHVVEHGDVPPPADVVELAPSAPADDEPVMPDSTEVPVVADGDVPVVDGDGGSAVEAAEPLPEEVHLQPIPPTPVDVGPSSGSEDAADAHWAAVLAEVLGEQTEAEPAVTGPEPSALGAIRAIADPRHLVNESQEPPSGTFVDAETEASLIVRSDSRVLVCLTTVPPEMMSSTEFSPIPTKGRRLLPTEQRQWLQDRRGRRQEAERTAPRSTLTCLMTAGVQAGADWERELSEKFQPLRRNEISSWRRRANAEMVSIPPAPPDRPEGMPGCFELLTVGDERIVIGLDDHVSYRVIDPVIAAACVGMVEQYSPKSQPSSAADSRRSTAASHDFIPPRMPLATAARLLGVDPPGAPGAFAERDSWYPYSTAQAQAALAEVDEEVRLPLAHKLLGGPAPLGGNSTELTRALAAFTERLQSSHGVPEEVRRNPPVVESDPTLAVWYANLSTADLNRVTADWAAERLDLAEKNLINGQSSVEIAAATGDNPADVAESVRRMQTAVSSGYRAARARRRTEQISVWRDAMGIGRSAAPTAESFGADAEITVVNLKYLTPELLDGPALTARDEDLTRAGLRPAGRQRAMQRRLLGARHIVDQRLAIDEGRPAMPAELEVMETAAVADVDGLPGAFQLTRVGDGMALHVVTAAGELRLVTDRAMVNRAIRVAARATASPITYQGSAGGRRRG